MRFSALGVVPAGLYQDEAFNGLDAVRVLAGEHPVYFTTNNGREPLFIYLASLSIAWLGRTPVAVRLPAALLGTLTIPLTAWLGVEFFNRRVALLAAAVLAITFWPLHLSRIAFRAVGLPFLLALALAAGWHGVRRRSRLWLLGAGLLYGLAFYSYLPVYVTPVLLVAFGGWLWMKGYRSQLRQAAPYWLLGTLLALLPLVGAAIQEPQMLLARSNQVSILATADGPLWRVLLQQVARGLGLFFWRGDTIPRHNLPGRPVFDPLMACFFVLGLVWLVRQRRKPAAILVLLWTFGMLLPTVLAEDTPHFLRAVGVLPLACFVPALGLEQGARWLSGLRWRRWLPAAGVAIPLLVSLGLTARDYFVVYAQDPQTGYAFQSAAVELADQMLASEGTVWASRRFADEWESIPFLLADRPVNWLADGQEPSVSGGPAALFLWPYGAVAPQVGALPTSGRLLAWQGPLIQGDLEPEPYPLYWGYRLDEPVEVPPAGAAQFSKGVWLLATDVLSQNGEAGPHLQVNLIWQVERPLEKEYTIFVHVVKEAGILSQDDSPPAGGALPTTWWQPGLQIVDSHSIALPEPFDPAQMHVIVGMYRPDTRDRLALLDDSGQPIGDHLVLDTAGE